VQLCIERVQGVGLHSEQCKISREGQCKECMPVDFTEEKALEGRSVRSVQTPTESVISLGRSTKCQEGTEETL
jgi:hypothetical protein